MITDFYVQGLPENGIECKCHAIITTDSFFNF